MKSLPNWRLKLKQSKLWVREWMISNVHKENCKRTESVRRLWWFIKATGHAVWRHEGQLFRSYLPWKGMLQPYISGLDMKKSCFTKHKQLLLQDLERISVHLFLIAGVHCFWYYTVSSISSEQRVRWSNGCRNHEGSWAEIAIFQRQTVAKETQWLGCMYKNWLQTSFYERLVLLFILSSVQGEGKRWIMSIDSIHYAAHSFYCLFDWLDSSTWTQWLQECVSVQPVIS